MNNNGNVMIEFVILLPLSLLIICSIIFLATEKIDSLSILSELVVCDEKKDNNFSSLFLNNNTANISLDRESKLMLAEKELIVSIYSKRNYSRKIMQNIVLTKEIMQDLKLLVLIDDFLSNITSHE